MGRKAMKKRINDQAENKQKKKKKNKCLGYK